jgi:hypothetical protein
VLKGRAEVGLGGDENAQKRGLREDFMKEEKKKSDIWG